MGHARASKFLAKGYQHLLVLAVEAARQNQVVQAWFPVVGKGLDDLVLCGSIRTLALRVPSCVVSLLPVNYVVGICRCCLRHVVFLSLVDSPPWSGPLGRRTDSLLFNK